MSFVTKQESVYFSIKGQIVIPRRIRKELEIEEGTHAYIETTADGILIKPVTPKFIRGLKGKYNHLRVMESLAEIKREEKER